MLMASSTAMWYAVSTGESQGAAASIASLNFPQPVAYTKEGGMSASGHSKAQDSCASHFDLLMQLLPLPSHSSSFIGCCTGNSTPQPVSRSQPQTTADIMEPLWFDKDSHLTYTYVPTYTNSSSTQQSLFLCTPQSSNAESLWDDDDIHLTYVPTYTNYSSTQQKHSLGMPQRRRPAAAICPPAPMRPRPSLILVLAEELHMCTRTE